MDPHDSAPREDGTHLVAGSNCRQSATKQQLSIDWIPYTDILLEAERMVENDK